VKAGEFIVVNPYMANDLIKMGLWDENMRNTLLGSKGSVQNIDKIPKEIRNIYKTVWEIPQQVLIAHSIARAPYIDQSQSLNLYFADKEPADKITKAHFYGWSNGLKTGSYYIRTKPATDSASFTLETSAVGEEEPVCDSCSS
jgi:ribonucleotide reductase alpha subunit